jgi:hypothetical protein
VYGCCSGNVMCLIVWRCWFPQQDLLAAVRLAVFVHSGVMVSGCSVQQSQSFSGCAISSVVNSAQPFWVCYIDRA